jgi:hypothetical protein
MFRSFSWAVSTTDPPRRAALVWTRQMLTWPRVSHAHSLGAPALPAIACAFLQASPTVGALAVLIVVGGPPGVVGLQR